MVAFQDLSKTAQEAATTIARSGVVRADLDNLTWSAGFTEETKLSPRGVAELQEAELLRAESVTLEGHVRLILENDAIREAVRTVLHNKTNQRVDWVMEAHAQIGNINSPLVLANPDGGKTHRLVQPFNVSLYTRFIRKAEEAVKLANTDHADVWGRTFSMPVHIVPETVFSMDGIDMKRTAHLFESATALVNLHVPFASYTLGIPLPYKEWIGSSAIWMHDVITAVTENLKPKKRIERPTRSVFNALEDRFDIHPNMMPDDVLDAIDIPTDDEEAEEKA